MRLLRVTPLLLLCFISACGGGGGGNDPTPLTSSSTSSSADIQSTSGINNTITGTSPKAIPNVTVSWIAPSQRENGAPISLSEIAAFKVYSGLSPNQLTDSIITQDSNATSQIFKGLKVGTYYFSVTTLDTAGRESAFSKVIEFAQTI